MDFDKEAHIVINIENDGLSVSDYLKELCRRWTIILIRAQCHFCRHGDFACRRPHGNYAHRVPEGKTGKNIWLPCGSNNLWRALEAIAEAEKE